MSKKLISRQVIGTSGLEVLGQGASFIGVIAYVRLTEDTALGSFFLFIAVLSVMRSLAGTGITIDAVRRMNQDGSPRTQFSVAVVLTLTSGAILAAGILTVRPILNGFIGFSAAVALALALPIEMLAAVYDAALKAERKNLASAGFITGQKILEYTTGSVLILAGTPVLVALVGSRVGTQALRFIGGLVTTEVRFTPNIELEELTRVLEGVGYATVVNISHLGQEWIDTLLIGAFLGRSAVAVYEIAWRLSSLGLFVTNGFVSVLYPRISEWVATDDLESLQRYGSRAYFYPVTLFIALLAGGYALGPDMITIIYEPGYGRAWLPFMVLLSARILYTVGRVSMPFLFAAGREGPLALVGVGSVLVNAVLNVVLIPDYGLFGAAIASFGGFLLFAGASYLLINKQQRARIPPSTILGAAGAAVLMGLCVDFAWGLAPRTPLWLGATILAGGVAFFLLLYTISPIFRKDIIYTVESGAIY